jgi:hypothetical protein
MSTAAQHLRALATERFPTLTPAEERLLDWVADGEEAHYESPTNADHALRWTDTWGPERTIHAELLRWLCVDRNAIRHVDPKGLSIHGARIDGTLDLRMVTMPFPIFLVRCALRQPMRLEFAEVRVLGIIGSTTQAIHGTGMVVHGNLQLRDGFDARSGVDLFNATIGGDLDCEGGTFYRARGIALQADGAKIGGAVLLRNRFQAEGGVRLVGATIGSDLSCSGGTFHYPGGVALDASGAKIGGTVFLTQGFQAEGGVYLMGTSIGGHLGCEGGAFHHAGGIALSASGVKIGGALLLRNRFQVEGLVHLDNARIQEDLDCRGASFSGTALNGLVGEAMTVGRVSGSRRAKTYGKLDCFTLNH